MFDIGNLKVPAASVGKGSLGSIQLANGEVSVPLIVVNGVKDGPTATITAAVHGSEVCVVAVAHRVAKTLDPKQLAGRVVIVPGANIIGLARADYAAWQDGENLSSAWPRASRDGGTTERLAAIVLQAIDRADLVLDIHSNPEPAMYFVTLARDAPAETHRLARAFGLTTIEQVRPPNYSRGLRQILGEKNVPMFTAEMAGSSIYSNEAAAVGQRGIFNVLKAAGMLAGAPEEHAGVAVMSGRYELVDRLRVNRGGLVRILFPPGVFIREGQTVLEVIDLLGDVVEEVRMPCDGYCWSYSTGHQHNYSAAVSEGTRIGYVFRRVESD